MTQVDTAAATSDELVPVARIKAALGVLVTTEMLAGLGFECHTRVMNAHLYKASDVPAMARALADRLIKRAAELERA